MPPEFVGAMIAVGGGVVGLLQMDGLQEISSGEPIFSSGTLSRVVLFCLLLSELHTGEWSFIPEDLEEVGCN
jgi:hypothetical protein